MFSVIFQHFDGKHSLSNYFKLSYLHWNKYFWLLPLSDICIFTRRHMTQEEMGLCLSHLVTILVHIIRHKSPSAVCFLPPPSLRICMLLLPQGGMSPEGRVPLPACRPGLQLGDGGPGVQLVRQSAQRGGVPSQTSSGYTFHQPACLIFSSHPPTESRTQYIRPIYPVTLFRSRGSDSDVSVNTNAAGVLVFQV